MSKFKYRPGRELAPRDYLAQRDHLVSTARTRGIMFFASVLFQVLASVAALEQASPIPRSVVPTMTFLYVVAWFWGWYSTSVKYHWLQATFINAEDDPTTQDPNQRSFWVDRPRIFLVLLFYLQIVCAGVLLLWGNPDPGSVLANIPQVVLWPLVAILALLLLSDWQRSAPTAVAPKGALEDRVRTLEVRADNARLPEPEVASPGGNDQQVPDEVFRLFVNNAPQAAILLAWHEVERSLLRLARERGLAAEGVGPGVNVMPILHQLAGSAEVGHLVAELQRMRNEVAQGNLDFTSYTAEEYLRVSRRIATWLRHRPRSTFIVVIDGVPDPTKKLGVIKAFREWIQGIGLKEAKELADHAPRAVKEFYTEAEAEAFRVALNEVGANARVHRWGAPSTDGHPAQSAAP